MYAVPSEKPATFDLAYNDTHGPTRLRETQTAQSLAIVVQDPATTPQEDQALTGAILLPPASEAPHYTSKGSMPKRKESTRTRAARAASLASRAAAAMPADDDNDEAHDDDDDDEQHEPIWRQLDDVLTTSEPFDCGGFGQVRAIYVLPGPW